MKAEDIVPNALLCLKLKDAGYPQDNTALVWLMLGGAAELCLRDQFYGYHKKVDAVTAHGGQAIAAPTAQEIDLEIEENWLQNDQVEWVVWKSYTRPWGKRSRKMVTTYPLQVENLHLVQDRVAVWLWKHGVINQ